MHECKLSVLVAFALRELDIDDTYGGIGYPAGLFHLTILMSYDYVDR